MAVPRRAGITRVVWRVCACSRRWLPLACDLYVGHTHMPYVLQLLGDVATPMQGRDGQSRAHIFTTSQRYVADLSYTRFDLRARLLSAKSAAQGSLLRVAALLLIISPQ
jgi:hypothetical protein